MSKAERSQTPTEKPAGRDRKSLLPYKTNSAPPKSGFFEGALFAVRGSHAELMAKKGVYYGLYTRQYREEQIQASMENE